MSPERAAGWIFAAILLVLFIWLAIVVIERIDRGDEPGAFDPSVFVAFME